MFSCFLDSFQNFHIANNQSLFSFVLNFSKINVQIQNPVSGSYWQENNILAFATKFLPSFVYTVFILKNVKKKNVFRKKKL